MDMERKRRTVRILLLRRKWWGMAACLLAAFAMIWITGKPAAVGASATERQLPIYCVEKDYKVTTLSFDRTKRLAACKVQTASLCIA